MIPFFKKLIEKRKEEVTFLLFEDDNPHRQESFSLRPGKLFLWLAGINMGIILLVMFFFYVTPMGTYLFNKDDRTVRNAVIDVSQRLNALQDSLQVRDRQLHEIQNVIRENSDTTFDIVSTADWESIYDKPSSDSEVMTFQIMDHATAPSLDGDQIIHSDLFSGSFPFPAEPPVTGSLTGSYNPNRRHYGIDIAASKGADVRCIADGVVISSDWTINYGYMMHILHGNGIVTIYKHFSEVLYTTGAVVKNGDIIGKVGESGVLASGPHIHFEIWKNGVPLDPAIYINLY